MSTVLDRVAALEAEIQRQHAAILRVEGMPMPCTCPICSQTAPLQLLQPVVLRLHGIPGRPETYFLEPTETLEKLTQIGVSVRTSGPG